MLCTCCYLNIAIICISIVYLACIQKIFMICPLKFLFYQFITDINTQAFFNIFFLFHFLKILNSTSSSPNFKVNCLFLRLMTALVIAKKDLPKIMGICILSSSPEQSNPNKWKTSQTLEVHSLEYQLGILLIFQLTGERWWSSWAYLFLLLTNRKGRKTETCP